MRTTAQHDEEVLIATAEGGKAYTPHPAGQFVWVCADVHDDGMKKSTWEGQERMRHEVRLVFQSEERDAQGVPLEHSEWFTLSLNEKARLRHTLEAWRGQPFTDDELAGFNVMALRGVCAYVQVAHKKKQDGSPKAVIQSIMRVPKGVGTISVSPEFKRIRDRVKPGTNGTPPKATAPQPAPDEYDEPEEEFADDVDDSIPF